MTSNRQFRIAVTRDAIEAVAERAPGRVRLLTLEDGVDLRSVDFLIPSDGGVDVADEVPSLTGLSVLQTLSAGTDQLQDIVPEGVTLCSARGARDGPVAEWVVGALLGWTTGLLRSAHERRWDPDRRLDDLDGRTVMVLGMGSIGAAVRDRLRPFGTEVLGVASRARDGVHGVDELDRLLPTADAVVVLTPLSDTTRGLIGASELAAMRDGALLVNAGRGPVVDSDALLAEVSGPRLRAVLDVTDPEPLPDDHPLWTAPGVLSITPHMAGDSPLGEQRAAEFAGDQVARWCDGEPLHNIVTKEDG
ncbi:MAG: dihydrofolate reductase [Solirubrobacterales bacterium]|nr:dihydrofolate reductase [Solirubrobacterales bacterium]